MVRIASAVSPDVDNRHPGRRTTGKSAVKNTQVQLSGEAQWIQERKGPWTTFRMFVWTKSTAHVRTSRTVTWGTRRTSRMQSMPYADLMERSLASVLTETLEAAQAQLDAADNRP